ncbi:MAG: hypothetical protein PUG16_05640 [Lachnospiraceae bacterium]|nr:hypothetical protein [Lachnospiraceae bacterium]
MKESADIRVSPDAISWLTMRNIDRAEKIREHPPFGSADIP